MESVLLLHDLSLYSKSSLTVSLPVLESAGLETALLPTSILSTQSDGFDTLLSLGTDKFLPDVMALWKKEGFSFSALYSGYFSSPSISAVFDWARRNLLEKNSLVLVDPVMGDDGEKYKGVDDLIVSAIKRHIKCAHIITPNWTEAGIILGREFQSSVEPVVAEAMAKELYEETGAKIVITSVPLNSGGLMNISYDGKECMEYPFRSLSGTYPGSGDLFASLLLALTMKGWAFSSAVKVSGEIATDTILCNMKMGRERRLGISLKPALDHLWRMFQQ